MKTLFPALCLSSLALSVMALSGCGSTAAVTTVATNPTLPEVNNCKGTSTTSPVQATPTANYAGSAFTGTVKAGPTPLIGASVQLYAAGTAGNGSAGTALLTAPLVTGVNGTFSVPAYTCPLSNAVLYVTATGGSLVSAGAANTASELGAVLGSCSSVTTAAVTVNEPTTVAMAFAMNQFMVAGGKVGATSTNASGIMLAAATAANLVNSGTGTVPGAAFPATGTAPSAKLNTVANLLNACIVGGATSSSCTQLFAATTFGSVAPTNTLDATVNLAKQPGTNVSALYALTSGITPYAPTLTEAPADWMLYATYAGGGMNDPSALSIDSTGTVWVANYFNIASAFSNTGVPLSATGYTDPSLYNSYGGAVNVSDNFWVANEQSSGSLDGGLGSLTVLNKSGSQGAFGGGGLNFPLAMAFDTSGVGWAVDYGDSAVSLFSASKASLSGSKGFQASNLVFPVAVATDADCNAYVANQSSNTVTRVSGDGSSFLDFAVGNGPSGVAVDFAGNVWTANYYGNSVGLITGGTTIASGSGFTAGGINHPQGIAPDGAGSVWVANYRGAGISELAGASASTPGLPLSPAAGWVTDAGVLEPFALAIDAAGNVWVSNFGSNTLTELVGVAVPVKTPLLGPVRIP